MIKKALCILLWVAFLSLYADLTPFSGPNLKRPILFVHGINSDMGTWGAHPAGYKCVSPVVSNVHYVLYSKVPSGIDYSFDTYTFSASIKCADGRSFNEEYTKDGIRVYGDGYSPEIQGWVDSLPASIKSKWTNKQYGKVPLANTSGLVNDYRAGSSADILSKKYGLNVAYKFDGNPNYGINHNGLEFYNSTIPSTDALAPFLMLPVYTDKVGIQSSFWTFDPGTVYFGQTWRLMVRLRDVLNEYYGTSWKTDASMQIDMVCHSQGGLITRNLFTHPSDADKSIFSSYGMGEFGSDGLDNPINHIRSIVTLNTPHLGTAAATNGNGVSSIDQIRTKVISMYNSDNYGSIHIAWWINIDIDPGVTIRQTLGDFIFGSQFLGYPKTHTPTSWLPPTSTMASATNIPAGSDFITGLQAAGYPIRPYDHRKVPITAYYGTAPGLAMKLLNLAKQAGYDGCNTGVYAGFDADQLLWYTQAFNGETCTDHVNDIAAAYQPIFEQADKDWSPYSDFIVDVSSQRADGLFNPIRDPFVARPLTTYPGDLGSPHMSFDKMGVNGTKLRGASEHGEDIIYALENPPKQKINLAPVYSLLLQ